MKEYRKDYPVSVLCDTLGVSLSGYYAWKNRAMSQHKREDTQLAERIHAVYHACRQVYGSPRIPGSNCAIKASPSPANGWAALCESEDSRLVVVGIGRSRLTVCLERVLPPIYWIKILPQLVPMRSGLAISRDRTYEAALPGSGA